MHFMKQLGCSLRQTSTCQKLAADFEKKLVKFQSYVMDKQCKKGYQLGQTANADQTSVFHVPMAYTVNKNGAKEGKIRMAGYEKQ